MTLLSSYLSKSKVKKVLSSKPGQEGFSLIELVVVVAVLAVLSAIAIPQFTNISQKARAAAASNTVATIAKECAVKYANGEEDPTYAAVTLSGYDSFTVDGETDECADEGDIVAESSDTTKYATFTYNIESGEKTCEMADSGVDADDRTRAGCTATGLW